MVNTSVSELLIKVREEGIKKVGADIKQFSEKLAPMGEGVKGSFAKITNGAKGMSSEVTNLTNGFEVLDEKGFNQMLKSSDKIITGFDEVGGKFKTNFQTISKGLSETKSDMHRFKMEWLSVMFFTMMANKRLQGMARASIKTFMDLAGANNEANQALVSFGAQMNFIRFTMGRALGEALLPFLPAFTKFVEKVVDFIEQNPEETVAAFVGALALFAGLGIAAQIALVAPALTDIISKLASKKATTAATNATNMGKGLKAIAAVGAIALIIDDVFFEEEGSFELENKLGAAALAGFLTKGGLAAKAKGGVVTFVVLSAIEFLQDPKSTGAFVADASNWLIGIVDKLVMLAEQLSKKLIGALFGKDVEFENDLFKEFGEGYTERIKELELEGKLTPSLRLAAGFETVGQNIREADDSLAELNKEVGTTMGIWTPATAAMNQALAGDENSLASSLMSANKEWKDMGDTSIGQITDIITNLDNIPAEVVTIHKIIRRYVNGGDSDADELRRNL